MRDSLDYSLRLVVENNRSLARRSRTRANIAQPAGTGRSVCVIRHCETVVSLDARFSVAVSVAKAYCRRGVRFLVRPQ